jgi:predicted dehydrogenase
VSTKIRWGILGTGKIAHRLAIAVRSLPDAELTAIGSRSAETADAFAEHEVALRFDRYEDVAACPEVDAVYVATPHSRHLQDATLTLKAGKPVLCEKPLTVNADESEQLRSRLGEFWQP